jgi:hypothetical protein
MRRAAVLAQKMNPEGQADREHPSEEPGGEEAHLGLASLGCMHIKYDGRMQNWLDHLRV